MNVEEISLRLKNERQETGGFISDEILLRMIAGELEVDVQDNECEHSSMPMAGLVPNLNNVTVTGWVVGIFEPRIFEGRKKGKMASMLIADSTQMLRVVLWNDKTALIGTETIKTGQLVRFSHCYTKEDRFGKTELHAGERCEIEIAAPDSKSGRFLGISQYLVKMNQVQRAPNNTRICVEGIIREVFPSSEFERKDGSLGRIMKLTLGDETGLVPVVTWNQKAEKLEGAVKKDLQLRILNGKTRITSLRNVEIHVDSESLAEVFSYTCEYSRISDLKDGESHVNVRGEIASIPVLKEVTTFRGEQVSLATFELKDGTGKILISAWRKHATAANTLKAGDKIELRDLYVKKGLHEELELATREDSSISVRS